MNHPPKSIQIIIKENDKKFNIDITPDVTLVDIFEIIYNCQYIDKYNISEHCGLLIYSQDQTELLNVISERPRNIYDLIENHKVLLFLRGSEFYKIKSEFKPQTSNIDKGRSTVDNIQNSNFISQNQPEVNPNDSVSQNNEKQSIKIINILNTSVPQGQSNQQQQQQAQQQVNEQNSHSNLLFKTQQQSQYNSQSQIINKVQIGQQSNQLRLIKGPTDVQLDIIINNIRGTYFIEGQPTNYIYQLKDLIINYDQEYSEIKFMNYKNEGIDEKQQILNYDYIQAYACSQGLMQERINYFIQSENNYFQLNEIYQYQMQTDMKSQIEKREHNLFKAFYSNFVLNEAGYINQSGSILKTQKHDQNHIDYETYTIMQNNRSVGELKMKINNNQIMKKQLSFLLLWSEYGFEVKSNEKQIIIN